LSAAAEHNYTAQRVLRALEVIILRPSSAPAVAAAVGIHARTARRILATLTNEGYVERRGGRGRGAHDYQATVRLLAMAAQLAPRLPLVTGGRQVIREIEQRSELTAYVAIPCYSDVLVVASSGARALRSWDTLPAHADAAGRILLAYRQPCRENLARFEPELAIDDNEAIAIVERGYVLGRGTSERCDSLAVVVPATPAPIAALAVQGSSETLTSDEHVLVTLLHEHAALIALTSRVKAT
jgi:DNA-binding IclR family transcriptional regulator